MRVGAWSPVGVIGFAKAHLREHDAATRDAHARWDGNDCMREVVAIANENPEIRHGKRTICTSFAAA
jgi:hypothetical protein